MRERRRIKRPTLSLPLAQAEGNVMLVVIIAVLIFLAGLVWITGGAAQKMTGRWNRTLSNELTIEIAPKLDDATDATTPEQRIQKVKEILAQYSAVTRIETVPREQLQNILKPWLGDVSSFPDLPLPTLLAVSLRPGHDLDFDDLAKQVSAAVPGVQVIAHYAWAGEVQRIANTITFIAWAAMGFIAAVLLLVMIFAARARLAMYAPEIEILHTLGASDSFVAREFARQSFGLSAGGAAAGFFALLIVLAIALMAAVPDANLPQLISANDFQLLQDWRREILGLLLLPPIVLVCNTFASHMAVLSALRRLT